MSSFISIVIVTGHSREPVTSQLNHHDAYFQGPAGAVVLNSTQQVGRIHRDKFSSQVSHEENVQRYSPIRQRNLER